MDSVTAEDYLQRQSQLERESRELMPYDPDTCTYPQPLRQNIYACLTCSRANSKNGVGVCYSCSIQCHSTHELVELFSKRNFACDCGTTRMANGKSCAVRARLPEPAPAQQPAPRLRTGSGSSPSFSFSSLDLPQAEDIPSSENTYNHNFQGRFCSCNVLYNPLVETRTMHQCYFGDACGEDWYHQDCILGYKAGLFGKEKPAGENKLGSLSPPGADAAAEASEVPVSDDEEERVPHFPELDNFDEFICWKCVQKHSSAFLELASHGSIVAEIVPHFDNVESPEEWKQLVEAESEPSAKRTKGNTGTHNGVQNSTPVSLFLKTGFRPELEKLKSLPESPLRRLLRNFPFLYEDDPIHQPQEDDQASDSSQSSLFEMGSRALSSLPVPQAIEGLQAYDNLKDQLKGFFKNFVDQNRVVTEKEVRDFFGKMEKKTE